MPEQEDGRVTLAIIQRDILHLTGLLESFLESAKERDRRITELERVAIPALDKRVTDMEPKVRTISRIGEIALYIVVVMAVGGIVWAVIQSGAAIP